ncbi:MAG TPA: MFS transporter [Thermoanaerobaculaceae bacterium]|nr:MFS transporter [Thermoanaerobaculaceae bacterium]
MEKVSKPLGPAYRWIVLAIMSLICFAQYYIYDSITPLGTLIKTELGYSGAEYGLLFSAYSVANVFLFMLLLGGILVDKLGLKISGILYGFLCFLGAALTALGAWKGLPGLLGGGHEWLRTAFMPEWSPQLKIMLLGRMIYGVGAECILVVNNKVLARWFKGKELAFAYGMNLTIMRLGTFLALNIQAPAANWFGLRGSLWFAALIMGVGFSTYFVYLGLERMARGRMGAPGVIEGGGTAPEEKFVLREAFSFDASFWFISLLCVTFYSAVFPFQAYAPDILVQKFGYSVVTAGHVTSALIFGTMIFTPILGALVDRKGRRATMMIYGSLLLVPCHLLIGYTHVWPIVPIFFVGVALSLVPAALWAAIPMMVPESRLGTAFGVIGYVQNVGLMLFPYIAGKIADAHTVTGGDGQPVVDYTSTMLMFAMLGLVGFVFSLLLKWADKRRKEGISIESVMLK